MLKREVLLRLIYRAFLDIRIASRNGDPQVGHRLSDLLHTLPLALVTRRDDDEEMSEIFRELEARAAARNLTKWLQNALCDLGE